MQSTMLQRRSLFLTWLSPLLLFLAILGLYFPVFSKLWMDWLENDNYSHGFFIPLISLYMVYSLRDELRTIPRQPVNWGLLLVFLGLAQFYVARVGSEFFMQRTSLILVLLGMILFLYGSRYTKRLLVPVVYLIFAIPLPAIIWNKIAFPLQLFSSAITEKIITLFGIPIFREGNVLHLSQTTLEVVDACSGLRSLTTMFALSAALAWFTRSSNLRKWILFFSAAPIAILANVIRLTLTAYLAHHYGEAIAQGFLHEFSGLLTFMLGLFMLIGTNSLLQSGKKA